MPPILRSKTSETADLEQSRPAVALQPYLLLVGSGGAGGAPEPERVHAILGGTDIGRGRPKSGRSVRYLALPDRGVSSSHARITRTAKGFEIVDLDSRNGTFVDGRAIQRQELRDGALLFFGGYAAVFRLVSDEAIAAIDEDQRNPLGPVPTHSPPMALAIQRLRRLAPTGEEVLLTGETGTGKEVYARAIHRASGRRGKFIGLNCAALPTELLESELFGYARGAHSQAVQAKRGLIEEAEGGTLFLDEIGDMPRGAQTKLLRFLQEREVLPLGSGQARKVDVRVLAATGQSVTDEGQPTLRRDLLMRLGTRPVVLPPLRERPEDLGALTRHFLASTRAGFDSPAFLAICLHDWPGNVRELEKVVREAIIHGDGDGRLGLAHLPEAISQRLAVPTDGGRARKRRSPRPAPSRDELQVLLRRHGGSVAGVARALDRRWAVVWRWMKQNTLDPAQFRSR